jgi:hypothetical protein
MMDNGHHTYVSGASMNSIDRAASNIVVVPRLASIHCVCVGHGLAISSHVLVGHFRVHESRVHHSDAHEALVAQCLKEAVQCGFGHAVSAKRWQAQQAADTRDNKYTTLDMNQLRHAVVRDKDGTQCVDVDELAVNRCVLDLIHTSTHANTCVIR